MPQTLKHHCAKCGTGYAGPECEPPLVKEDIIWSVLKHIIGENPERPGLVETPRRVVEALEYWTSGYRVDIPALFKMFDDDTEYDEMVVRKGIPFHSLCEHHLCPIVGVCTVAYIPNDNRIIGLSKIDRLVDAFARRLQVQERLTSQIADSIQKNISPLGIGVHITARHFCIETRGVKHERSDTITCAVRGVFKTKPEARAEFLALMRD